MGVQRAPKAKKTRPADEPGLTLEAFEAIVRSRSSSVSDRPQARARGPSKPRLRGEQSTTRQRASQRVVPGIAAIGGHPGAEVVLVGVHARKLEVVREWWTKRRDARAALAALRAALPKVVLQNKGTLEAANGALRTIVQLLASSEAVHGLDDTHGSADELWLHHAQHDLDDDDLARILSPAGYRRDRAKALAAVRSRRRAMLARDSR